jgi:hypothetical protein
MIFESAGKSVRRNRPICPVKKIPEAFIFAALVFASCVSPGPGEKSTAASAPVPGVLTVTGIPAAYINGVILAGGSGENGGNFTHSSKVLRKISGTRVEIKLYSEDSPIQKPFTGSGNYLVSVELHKAGDSKDSEPRYFIRNFVNGSAEIDWTEGSAKPPSPP